MAAESDGSTEYTLYFPTETPEKDTNYRNNPPRERVVVGETIDVIIIAKKRSEETDTDKISAWKVEIQSLCSLVTVSTNDAEAAEIKDDTVNEDGKSKEILCAPYASQTGEGHNKAVPWHEMEDGSLICHQKAALASVPPNCQSCTFHVALWSPPVVNDEVTSEGILETFLRYTPEVIMQQYGRTLKKEVSHSLPVLNPPQVSFRHAHAGGKQFVSIKVSNKYAYPVCIQGLSVLPDATRTPVSVSPQSVDSREDLDKSDDTTQYTIKQPSGDLPMTLNPGESHTFLGSLHMKNQDVNKEHSSSIGLMANLKWARLQSKPALTCYKLPSLYIRYPGLVIVVEPPREVHLNKTFHVRYTIINQLQDFLSLRLIWNPGKALLEAKAKESEDYQQSVLSVLNSVVCHQPSVTLGACKTGSTLMADVAFRLLRPGMFELGQHMKLTLQYQMANMIKGHRRKGSITSTHSMPSGDPRRDTHIATRSASMCPLDFEDLRRGSLPSNRGHTPTHSPSVGSPLHRKSADSLSSAGNIQSSNKSLGQSSQALSVAGTVQEKSVSALSSPASGRPSPLAMAGNITPQQVLKRNCQVYLLQEVAS